MPATLIPLVGAFFRPPANSLLKAAQAGQRLYPSAEPMNEFDPNAIRVEMNLTEISPNRIEGLKESLLSQGFDWEEVRTIPFWHVGYFKKEFAAEAKRGKWNLEGATLQFSLEGKPLVKLFLPPSFS